MARRAQRIAGTIAIVLLSATTVVVASESAVRAPGVVVADQTFTVASPEPGLYMSQLESGRLPIAGGFVSQRSLQSERAEVMAMHLPASVTTGGTIVADDVIAVLDSQRSVRQLAEETQRREELRAQRDLLAAGGRPEAVAAAERAVAVSEARRAEAEAVYRRASDLTVSGAVSAAQVDEARLLAATLAQEVALARARVAEVRMPARREELAAIDAQIAVADSRVAEIAALLDSQQVRSPIAGLAEVGGELGELQLVRVFDLDPVYVHAAVAESDASGILEGSAATFQSSALGVRLDGRVAEVAESVALGPDGRPVIFVTIEVPNPGLRLRAGMHGSVEFASEDAAARLVAIAAAMVGR